MRKTRRTLKRSPSPASSDDEPLIKKTVNKAGTKTESRKKILNKQKKDENAETSSSESDIADYLQDPNKLDLNSSFFQNSSKSPNSFEDIEKNIFSGVTRLSDSDSDDDNTATNDLKKSEISQAHTEPINEKNKNNELDVATKLNFQQLQNYTKQIEEAKKQVEQYKAHKEALTKRKPVDNDKLDISHILSAEKASLNRSASAVLSNDNTFHSSDFDSCSDSEKDWEEVAVKDSQEVTKKSDVPIDGLQITIELPHRIRKSKGVDLLTAMKRKMNRVKKENQVYIHKVHLLCWIAHGNFVNSTINNEKILGLSLSLLPSKNSYPSGRIDLSYLEQMLQWYKKTIILTEKSVPKNSQLLDLLETQISKKQVYNKKMLTYIFIALLRALGVQCRLVLSFVVEPLRPPASELHSLSTKPENETKQSEDIKQEKKLANEKESKKKSNANVKQTKQTVVSNKDKPATTETKPVNKKTGTKIKTEKKKENPVENKKSKTDKTDNESKNVKTSVANSRKGSDKTKNTSNTKTTKSSNSKEKQATSKTKPVEKRPPPKPEKDNDEIPVKAKRTKKDTGEKLASGPVTRSRSTTPTIISELSVTSKRTSSRAKKPATQKNPKISEKANDSTPSNTQQSHRKGRSQKNDIKQLDGLFDSESENSSLESSFEDDLTNENYTSLVFTYLTAINKITIPQLDGADDDKTRTSTKPNLKKIRHKDNKSESISSVEKSKKDTGKTSATTDTKVHLVNLKTKQALRNVSSSRSSKKSLPSEMDSEEEFTAYTKRSQSTNPKPSPSTSRNICKYFSSPGSSNDVRNDIMQLVKGRISLEKENRKAKRVKKPRPKRTEDSDGDSDYEPEPRGKKHNDSEDEFMPKTKVKRRIPVKKSGDKLKVLSSDEETNKKKKGIDVWAEVFLEDEEKWISVDVVRGEVHCIQQLFARATHPVSYIVAWNNDDSLKDITVRYCNNFNTATRKLRVENNWWQESLKPFIGKKNARDKEEDEELARQQLEKPLPTSIAEYKNHPLYVLKRHLLKFESIYPPDAATLGFVRGEPVYSRDCVYTLHSREIWVKHAKVVKPGETPYKIVKARPKYDKLSNTVISDQMLEIFGPWQTEDYVPPTAENGIVPRNAYGNVELFKPCMLPKKTVHLKLPGLSRVAKKLDIDCAPAIVGFDFHSGWSHPTYDGFVVCEEYEDQLIAAWELEQEEIEKREQEKIDKRVYDNWKRLIRGLLIRERLKAKYDFSAGPSKKQKTTKAPKVVKKKRRISDSD